MRRRRSLRTALTATVTAVATAGLTALGGGAAHAATPLPTHVFAPYFESWTGESPAALSAQPGAKHLTMAFLQTESKGSCTPYWNGSTDTPVSSSSFGSDIKTIQGKGGDVIPSFGGYTADTTGTEIADSCTDVQKIAAAYEKATTPHHVPQPDKDIGGRWWSRAPFRRRRGARPPAAPRCCRARSATVHGWTSSTS